MPWMSMMLSFMFKWVSGIQLSKMMLLELVSVSRIDVLIEDKEFVESLMDGQSWKAGNFSRSLRLSLWLEHLGPVLDRSIRFRILSPMQHTGTSGWRLLRLTPRSTVMSFHVSPMILSTPGTILCFSFPIIFHATFFWTTSNIFRSAFRQSTNYCKEKIGHTTIDLGIALEKLEAYQNGDIKNTDPMERVQSVRGHLVSFPLDFAHVQRGSEAGFHQR
ncbi:phospholipase D zeta 1-like isoform X1 [Musa acuminata AAA Group]|uniref:phospholipase D zeta 1-like isoform X1 n=1 Tax=Musa acuminata AAA Group TaxID=214697 RepID=UPI0031D30D40